MIDLHHFCGLSVRETAGVLSVSRATVMCDLRFARAWLHAYLGRALNKATVSKTDPDDDLGKLCVDYWASNDATG